MDFHNQSAKVKKDKVESVNRKANKTTAED